VFGEVYGLDLKVLNADDISRAMWRGHISDEDFFAEISRRRPDLPAITAEDFRRHMDNFERSEPVYALAAKARAAGIKTGILSNVFGVGVKPLRQGGFYDGFDPVLLSCEVGYAKPDPEFYQMAIDHLGVAPEEIVFIDDQQYALDPAKAVGMHVILATAPEQIVNDTKALLLKENGVKL
jgi:putative hydrolase of the HAD superfamily